MLKKSKPVDKGLLTDLCSMMHTVIFNFFETKEVREDKRFDFKKLKGGTLRSIDVSGCRFIEQNKNTNSEWAKMARDGHQISWCIRLEDNKWLARVVNGEVILL